MRSDQILQYTRDTNSVFTPVEHMVSSLYSFKNYFKYFPMCLFTNLSNHLVKQILYHPTQCLLRSVCFLPLCEHFMGGGHWSYLACCVFPTLFLSYYFIADITVCWPKSELPYCREVSQLHFTVCLWLQFAHLTYYLWKVSGGGQHKAPSTLKLVFKIQFMGKWPPLAYA